MQNELNDDFQSSKQIVTDSSAPIAYYNMYMSSIYQDIDMVQLLVYSCVCVYSVQFVHITLIWFQSKVLHCILYMYAHFACCVYVH